MIDKLTQILDDAIKHHILGNYAEIDLVTTIFEDYEFKEVKLYKVDDGGYWAQGLDYPLSADCLDINTLYGVYEQVLSKGKSLYKIIEAKGGS